MGCVRTLLVTTVLALLRVSGPWGLFRLPLRRPLRTRQCLTLKVLRASLQLCTSRPEVRQPEVSLQHTWHLAWKACREGR